MQVSVGVLRQHQHQHPTFLYQAAPGAFFVFLTPAPDSLSKIKLFITAMSKKSSPLHYFVASTVISNQSVRHHPCSYCSPLHQEQVPPFSSTIDGKFRSFQRASSCGTAPKEKLALLAPKIYYHL